MANNYESARNEISKVRLNSSPIITLVGADARYNWISTVAFREHHDASRSISDPEILASMTNSNLHLGCYVSHSVLRPSQGTIVTKIAD